MKKLIIGLLAGMFLGSTSYTLAATVLFPYQGGTGIGSVTAGDIGKVLTVSNNAPFTFTLSTLTGGGGGSGGGAWATSSNNTLAYLTAQWTALIGGTATTSSSRLQVNGDLTAYGTATVGSVVATSTTASTFINTQITNATSTNEEITGQASTTRLTVSRAMAIGTSTERYPLTVVGSNPTAQFFGNIPSLQFLSTQSNQVWSLAAGFNDATSFSLVNGANQRLLVNTSGNLGVGTTSPTFKLSVSGSILTDSIIASGSATNSLPFILSSTSTSANSNKQITIDGVVYARNSTGIQSAVNNACAQGVRFVRMPAGVYPFTNSVSLCSNLEFFGDGTTTILIDSTGGVANHFIDATNTDSLSIHDFSIRGNGSVPPTGIGPGNGINIYGGTNVEVYNIALSRLNDGGILIKESSTQGSNNTKIYGVNADCTVGAPIFVSSDLATRPAKNTSIFNNTVCGNDSGIAVFNSTTTKIFGNNINKTDTLAGQGIEIGSNSIFSSVSDVQIYNNTVIGTPASGISVAGGGTTTGYIANNDISFSTQNGITLSAISGGFTISGNQIYRNQQDGIKVVAALSRFIYSPIITGNTINDNGLSSNGYCGIEINSQASGGIRRAQITNNVLANYMGTSTQHWGICFDNETGSNINNFGHVINDNQIEGYAQAFQFGTTHAPAFGSMNIYGNIGATSSVDSLVLNGNASTTLFSAHIGYFDWINATDTTATSTFANGINLTGGCLAIKGTCLSAGTGSSFSYLFPNNATTTALTFSGGATTTNLGITNQIYANGSATSSILHGLLTALNTGSLFGIGTNNPQTKLDVVGGGVATGVNPLFAVRNNQTSTGAESTLILTNTTASSFARSSGSGEIGVIRTNSPSAGNTEMIFRNVDNGAGGLTEAMRISYNHYLGIGTTSPYAKLSVAGAVVGESFTATSTTATNTAPVFQSSTSTISVLNGVVHVDGNIFPKTGAGIQQAINFCYSLRPRCNTVDLLDTTARVDTSIEVRGGIKVTSSASSTLSAYETFAASNGIFYHQGTDVAPDNVIIEKITFNLGGNATAFSNRGGDNIQFRDNFVSGTTTAAGAILFDGTRGTSATSSRFLVLRNTFRNLTATSGASTIYFLQTSGKGSINPSVLHNTFENTGGPGVKIDELAPLYNLTVSNNSFINQLSGNHYYDPAIMVWGGISNPGRIFNTVVANNVYRNSTNYSGYTFGGGGVWLYQSYNTSVTDNMFTGSWDPTGQDDYIFVAPGRVANVSDGYLIANNTIEGVAAAWDPDSMKNVNVTGNTVRDSGHCFDVGYNTQINVHIHGNSCINSYHRRYNAGLVFYNASTLQNVVVENNKYIDTTGSTTLRGDIMLTGGLDFSTAIVRNNYFYRAGSNPAFVAKELGGEKSPLDLTFNTVEGATSIDKNPSFSNGQIPFFSSTTTGSGTTTNKSLTGSNNFYWDWTNQRLGIGTSSPYAKLSVAGFSVFESFSATSSATSSVIGAFAVGTSSAFDRIHVLTASGTGMTFDRSGTTDNESSEIKFKYGNNTFWAGYIRAIKVAGGGGALSIGTGVSGGASANDALTITNGQRVGLGITAPENKLQVVGGIQTSSSASSPAGAATVLSQESGYGRLQSFGSTPLSLNPLGNNVGIATTSPSATLGIIGNILVNNTSTSTFMGSLNVQNRLQIGTSSIYLNGSGTSTFSHGISLASGCIEVNGTCISLGAGSYTDAQARAAVTGLFPATTTSNTWLLSQNFDNLFATNASATNFLSSGSTTLGSLNVSSSTLGVSLFSRATGTALSIGQLTGSLLNGFGLSTCTGSNALQWSGGLFSCAAVGGSASTTIYTDNNHFTATQFFTYASTTAITTTASSTMGDILGGLGAFTRLTVSGAGTSTQLTGALSATNFAMTGGTSTAANGINLTGGCFAINGVCVGGGSGSGTVNSGTQGQTAWYSTNGTAVSGTSSLIIDPTTGRVRIASNNTNAYLNVIATGDVQGMQVMGSASTDAAFTAFVSGDAFTRFSFLADGTMKWGGGSASTDVGFTRRGAGQLSLDPYGAATRAFFGIGSTTPTWALAAAGSGFFDNEVRASSFTATTSTSTFKGIRADCFSTDGVSCLGAAGGSYSGTGGAGQVTYWTGATSFTGASDFVWDNTLKHLGIGSSTPWAGLSIVDADESAPAFVIASSTDYFSIGFLTRWTARLGLFGGANKAGYETHIGGSTSTARFALNGTTIFGRQNSDTLMVSLDPLTVAISSTALTADSVSFAPGVVFDEMTDASLGVATMASTSDHFGVGNGCNDGGAWFYIRPNELLGAVANDGGWVRGSGVFNTRANSAATPPAVAGGTLTSTGTPVMEVTICTPHVMSSIAGSSTAIMPTLYGFGFGDTAVGTAFMSSTLTAPANGSFIAASTTDDWWLYSINGNVGVRSNTGVSTSTTKTAPQTFRIAMTATATYAYIFDRNTGLWNSIGVNTTQQTKRDFTWFLGVQRPGATTGRIDFLFRNLKVWYSPSYRF